MKLGAIVTGEPIPGYTLKTQYRNPAIFSFFFFSLVAIETNFCRIFFIFLISLFGEISPGKEPLPLLPTYGPISRLSSSARGKGQGASAFARERESERARIVFFVSVRARVRVRRCLNRWAYLSPSALTGSRLRTSSCGARRSCNQANQEEEEQQQRSRNRSSSTTTTWKRTESSKTGDKRCRKTLKKHQQQQQ